MLNLVLIYEYVPISMQKLFEKLQSLDSGYVNPSFQKKYVYCTFKPKMQRLRLTREDIERRIEWRIEDQKAGKFFNQ